MYLKLEAEAKWIDAVHFLLFLPGAAFYLIFIFKLVEIMLVLVLLWVEYSERQGFFFFFISYFI